MGKIKKLSDQMTDLKINKIHILISLIIFALTGFLTSYYYFKKQNSIEIYQNNLEEIVQNQRKKIHSFIFQQLQDLELKAKKLSIENIDLIKSNSSVNSSIIEPNNILVSRERKVLLSNNKAVPIATDFSNGPYKSSNLGKLLDRVITILSPDISNFDYYPTQTNETLFAASPIIDSKNILKGFLVNEIPVQNFINSLKNNKNNINWVITKSEDQKTKVLFNSSDSPNYDKEVLENYPELFKKIISEESGKEIIKSSNGDNIIGNWTYEPYTTWNIAAFTAYNKAIQNLSIIFYICFILIVLTILILIFLLIWVLIYLSKKYKAQVLTRFSFVTFLILLFGLVIFSTLIISYKIYNLKNKTYEKTENYTQIQLQSATKQIERNLFNTEFSAYFLADEIKNLKLNDHQIEQRVETILKKRNKYVESITIAYTDKKIGAPTWVTTATGISKYNLQDLYDYTQIRTETLPQANWYNKALASGKYWSSTYTSPFTKNQVVTFSIPFKYGVLAFNYRLEELGKKLNAFLGETSGTSWIVESQSNVIYQVKDQETSALIDINEQSQIIKNALKKESGQTLMKDAQTGKYIYIWFEPIAVANWNAIHLTLKEQIQIPAIDLRHFYILLLSLIIIFLLLSFALYFYIYQSNEKTKNILITFSSIIPILGIILIWYNARLDKFDQDVDTKKITSTAKLAKYLDMAEQKATQNHMPKPIPVTIGIDIYSINISSTKDSIILACHLQQKYPKGYNPELRLPQAKKLELRKMYEREANNEITIGFDIYAEISQDLDNSKYPFDRPKLEIFIEPKSTTESFIFVPNMNLKKFIQQDYEISDFSIRHSYYTYNQLSYSLNDQDNGSTNSMGLTLEIQLQRDTTNPLMTDFIPLIIIFLAIFLIKLLGDSYLKNFHTMTAHDALDSRINIAAAYTALFFTVILMHPRMRGIAQSSNIIYVEYFFFCAYASILIFQLMPLTKLFLSKTGRKINDISTYLFWPIQTLIWFLFTVLTFYNP